MAQAEIDERRKKMKKDRWNGHTRDSIEKPNLQGRIRRNRSNTRLTLGDNRFDMN
jgi:hypothetical protein